MKKVSIFLIVVFLFAGSFSFIKPQPIVDAMRSEAVREMEVGRFGEAIDLLNRYIAAHPQQPDGYNLRGLCNEKRQQFEMAVYDFRSAKKLAPNDKEINANLARATSTWYTLLYNNIEGYKREIAINPKKPSNYLEIGKCYKNLGQWAVAEEWYDKYLTMEHASPDEIIRYSEILAKNNHIAKGWPILKRYTDEYPNDQRLWSRFGYFSLWLGKTKIAIEAFENSLALKPYFKEAMDGLDQARGKGYIYTVNDTSTYKHYNYGLPQIQPAFVYPIDRFYRTLKKNPQDNETRLKLVKALMETNRFEEASQQIALLQSEKYDSLEVAQISGQADSLRQIAYQKKVEEYKIKLASDSTNKDAVVTLGQYYSKLQSYDSALIVYSNYLNHNPDDADVLFLYAQAQANNRDFFKAQDKMQILLKMDPQNLKYQLFMAQLDVWIGQNLDEAKQYLSNVMAKDPNNLAVLVSMSSLSMQQNNFTDAENYMAQIKSINPDSPELKTLQSSMTLNKFRYKQEQNFAILKEAEALYGEQKCEDALPKYEQFLANTENNSLFEKEYADVNVCAGHYDKAIEIYTNLLNAGYDFGIDYSRAMAYFAKGDSIKSLQEFQRLAKDNPDDFNSHLYLGDSYFRMREYGKAMDVYDAMKEKMKIDSSQVAMINMREGWVPPTGFRGIWSTFPSYTLITPYASVYLDNQQTRNFIEGLRVDLGLTSFLSLGVEGYRTTLYSNNAFYYSAPVQITSNSLRWAITLRLAEALIFGVDFGSTYYGANIQQPIADVFLRSEVAGKYSVYGSYTKEDASQVIYSPSLIIYRLNTDMFRLGGSYQTKSGLRFSSDISYYSFSDPSARYSQNTGYNLSLRIGKYFYQDFLLGYEFYTAGFRFVSPLYYSPTNYSSHNIFADWNLIRDTTVTITLGGLIGFVANSNFILRQGYIASTVRLADRFTIQGRISGGSSALNVVGYSSFGATISAYWSL